MKKTLLAATVIAFAGITALSAKGNHQSSQINMIAVQDTVKTDTTSNTQSSTTTSQDTVTTKTDSTDKKQ